MRRLGWFREWSREAQPVGGERAVRQDLLRDAKLGSPPHKLLHSLLHGTPRPSKGEVEHAGRNGDFGDIINCDEGRGNGSEELDTLAINWDLKRDPWTT